MWEWIVNHLVPLIVTHILFLGAGAFIGARKYRKKYEWAANVYCKLLDEKIHSACQDGPDKVEIDGRAIVSSRNSLRDRFVNMSKLLNSDIDVLETQINRLVERPQNKELQDEAYKTIQVLKKTWPDKAKILDIEWRKTLAEMGIE